MGWFDEQIKQRKLSDQEVFEDSFMQVAAAVLGNRIVSNMKSDRMVTKLAIDDILKYYKYKPAEIPQSLERFEDQLEYVLRPHGLMTRYIKLEEGWYKDSFGPILAFDKEGTPKAVLPGDSFGYYFIDSNTGEKVRLNKNNEDLFDDEAICFYHPLPLKKLGISDLLLYMKNCITTNDIIQIVIFTLMIVLVDMISPKIHKLLTGPVLESKDYSIFSGIAIFMVAVTISSQLISVTKQMVIDRINIKTSVSVEAAVMMRILSLPAGFFRKYSSGELSSRASSVNSLCSMLVSGIFSTGITSIMSLLYVTQIVSFTPALLLPSIIIILTTVTLGVVSTLMQLNISRKSMQLSAKESGMSYALLSGIQKIKLSGAEKRAFARWANLYAQEAEYNYNPPLVLKINSVLVSAVSIIGNIVLYYLAVESGIGQSDYFAFSSSYGLLTGAFSALASIILSIANIKPILEMAEPILNEVPETSEGKEVLTRVSGNIELNNVFFRYEETQPYIIRDLTLKIRSGEYVAIVGKTGCGKSTLIRLMLGFEKPEKGAIYYDGKDLNTIDLKSLRKKIGTVTQNGDLFTGSIFENITVSAPELNMDEAWEAAETAGIANDIKEMPMGMQTLITEGSGGISGGQKQRIMIARAIAHKPKILIFDEATSALDNKTQKQVSEALDRLKCTRIVVAHRLSTIRNCDRIIVLSDGNIIEDGTYDELIAKNGFFAELVERQRLDLDQ